MAVSVYIILLFKKLTIRYGTTKPLTLFWPPTPPLSSFFGLARQPTEDEGGGVGGGDPEAKKEWGGREA